MENIFETEGFDPGKGEQFETILERGSIYVDQGFRLERILSFGQSTDPGVFMEQGWDEWVVMARGNATMEFEDGRLVRLDHGDNMIIKAKEKHRIARCSEDCVWLALHFKAEEE